MRDRERANRGGRADGRLVRLGRRRRRCDGREGRNAASSSTGAGAADGAAAGASGAAAGSLVSSLSGAAAGAVATSSTGARVAGAGCGTTDVAAGSLASTLAGAASASGGCAAGAAVDSLASTLIGAAATGGAAPAPWCYFIGGSGLQRRRGSRSRCARGGCARSPEPSNRRGRADGCIVLGEGGRAYRAERDKPGRQRRGYRGPHRRHGGR